MSPLKLSENLCINRPSDVLTCGFTLGRKGFSSWQQQQTSAQQILEVISFSAKTWMVAFNKRACTTPTHSHEWMFTKKPRVQLIRTIVNSQHQRQSLYGITSSSLLLLFEPCRNSESFSRCLPKQSTRQCQGDNGEVKSFYKNTTNLQMQWQQSEQTQWFQVSPFLTSNSRAV